MTGCVNKSHLWSKYVLQPLRRRVMHVRACLYVVLPQNRWPQFVWTGKVAVCRHTGQCQSLWLIVAGQSCEDS